MLELRQNMKKPLVFMPNKKQLDYKLKKKKDNKEKKRLDRNKKESKPKKTKDTEYLPKRLPPKQPRDKDKRKKMREKEEKEWDGWRSKWEVTHFLSTTHVRVGYVA